MPALPPANAGTCSSAGGRGGGRTDAWEPQEEVYWRTEDKRLGDEHCSGERALDSLLYAERMKLIQLDAKASKARPDPPAAAKRTRGSFARPARARHTQEMAAQRSHASPSFSHRGTINSPTAVVPSTTCTAVSGRPP